MDFIWIYINLQLIVFVLSIVPFMAYATYEDPSWAHKAILAVLTIVMIPIVRIMLEFLIFFIDQELGTNLSGVPMGIQFLADMPPANF